MIIPPTLRLQSAIPIFTSLIGRRLVLAIVKESVDGSSPELVASTVTRGTNVAKAATSPTTTTAELASHFMALQCRFHHDSCNSGCIWFGNWIASILDRLRLVDLGALVRIFLGSLGCAAFFFYYGAHRSQPACAFGLPKGTRHRGLRGPLVSFENLLRCSMRS